MATAKNGPRGRDADLGTDPTAAPAVDDAPATGEGSTVAGERALPERRIASPALPMGRDRYALGRELGRGGMGVVFEAEDRQFGRRVALKRLLPDSGQVAEERFISEAIITASLDHSGIPAVHERGTLEDGAPYYSMRKIEGRTLSGALTSATSAAERLALLPAVVQTAQTIGFAHGRGVVHRDLKPDNIIVDKHGQVVVLDWGLAKLDRTVPSRPGRGGVVSPSGGGLTMDGSAMGTPAYMSPEQAEGRLDELDARTDVFGLGAILYEVLTGRPPFLAESGAEALARASACDFPSIRSLSPKAPARLVAACERALRRDRDARFASAHELADELTAFTTDAVSGAGARVVDWVAGAVGAGSVIAFVAVLAILGSAAGMLHATGFFGILLLVVSVLGCGMSVAEWITRGRYRLSAIAVGFALATLCIAIAGFAMGYREALEVVAAKVGFADAVAYRQAQAGGLHIALASLAFGSALAGFQAVIWGVARRRSAAARR